MIGIPSKSFMFFAISSQELFSRINKYILFTKLSQNFFQNGSFVRIESAKFSPKSVQEISHENMLIGFENKIVQIIESTNRFLEKREIRAKHRLINNLRSGLLNPQSVSPQIKRIIFAKNGRKFKLRIIIRQKTITQTFVPIIKTNLSEFYEIVKLINKSQIPRLAAHVKTAISQQLNWGNFIRIACLQNRRT